MTVGRVTVTTTTPGAASDAGYHVRLRLAIERIAGAGDDRRDHSVLVVRRLQVGGATASAAEAFRADLASMRRRAARPALGRAPASADAVLFADQAELLACLTSDIVAGRARQLWYWRHVAPALPAGAGAALAQVWGSEIRWLPAMLAQLGPREAVAAVTALPEAVATRLLGALRAAHAMASPAAGADATGAPWAPWAPTVRAPVRGGVAPEASGSGGPAASVAAADPAAARARLPGRTPAAPNDRPAAPWRTWPADFPDLPASAGPAAEALLGVALVLHHTPALSSSPDFAAAVDAWLAPAPLTAGAVSAGREGALAGAPRLRGPVRSGVVASPPGEGRDVVHDAGGAATAEGTEASAAPPGPLFPLVPSAHEIRTAYAGVLYLANLIVWLDGPSIGPGGWGGVELLGRHLLAGRPGVEDDPLWALLAGLDGRPVGSDPEVPIDSVLRLPPDWLRRWAPGPRRWHWSPAGSSVVLRDRQGGWVVADVARAKRPALAVARAEVARLHRHGVEGVLMARPRRRRSISPARRGGRQRWANSVGAFARWLLATRGIGPDALAVPGRVSATGTHVDLVCRLSDANLSARRCGLDHDPGWVPALGRVVSFHFD